MIRTILHRILLPSSGDYHDARVFVRSDIPIPFVPYPGLVLRFQEEEDEIEDVIWNVEGQCFEVKLSTIFVEEDRETDEEVIERLLALGWQHDASRSVDEEDIGLPDDDLQSDLDDE